jgi:hypothetical protein
MIWSMDDDVSDLLDDIETLLPPRTTEYRSGAVGYPWTEREEPATEPIRIAAAGSATVGSVPA